MRRMKRMSSTVVMRTLSGGRAFRGTRKRRYLPVNPTVASEAESAEPGDGGEGGEGGNGAVGEGEPGVRHLAAVAAEAERAEADVRGPRPDHRAADPPI